jgi:hypothetical protein
LLVHVHRQRVQGGADLRERDERENRAERERDESR